MANTFLAAKGYKTGKSLIEKDKIIIAKEILEKADKENCKLILPEDVVVAKSIDDLESIDNVNVDKIREIFQLLILEKLQ